MNCPSCGESVPDDAAICSKCDHILDPSLFSDAPPPDDAPPKARPRPASGAKKGVKKRPATGSQASVKKPASGRMPEAPPRRVRTPPEERAAPELDWRAMARESANAPHGAPPPPSDLAAPDEFLNDARYFLRELNFSDKLAFWGGVGVIISCFFPWKETFEGGEILGLMSLGAAAFAAGVIYVSALVIRVKKFMPRLHALVPWLAQFGSACFVILWCLIFIKLAWDPTITRSPEGNRDMWMSSPSLGVFLALAFAALSVVGTLLGLREKPT